MKGMIINPWQKNFQPKPPQKSQRMSLKETEHRAFTAKEMKEAIRSPIGHTCNIIWYPD